MAANNIRKRLIKFDGISSRQKLLPKTTPKTTKTPVEPRGSVNRKIINEVIFLLAEYRGLSVIKMSDSLL